MSTNRLRRGVLKAMGGRRLAIVGVVLGIAFGTIGVAVAGSSSDDPSVPPTTASDASGTPDQISADRNTDGPGLSADEAIARVLTTLGDPSVVSATVIQDPRAGSSTTTGDTPWLSIQIDSDQGDGTKQVWLGQVVQGAVSDLMRTTETRTSDVLDGAQIVDRDTSGNQVISALGHGSVVGGQVFDSPSDAELLDHVRQTAKNFGLTVRSVEVLHPLDSALAVTLVVPDGPVDWTIDQLREALEGSPALIEGLYYELEAPSGQALLRGAGASRIPGGALWFAKGQDDRFGAQHG